MTKATANQEHHANDAEVLRDSDSKTFNSHNKIAEERIWIIVKLTIQKLCSEDAIDERVASIEYRVFEPIQGVQEDTCEYPRSLNMSRRRPTSPPCMTHVFVGETRRIRRNHKKRLVV